MQHRNTIDTQPRRNTRRKECLSNFRQFWCMLSAMKRYSGNLVQHVPSNRPRILYVEDEDPNWEIAEARLRAKYDLHRAKNSASAFELLGRHQFELILMDIQLTNSAFDGIEITKLLRGVLKPSPPEVAQLDGKIEIPIIFVTAYTARYSKEDLKKVGGDDVIAKPVDFTQLSLAITRLIARNLL